jgi:hypothetical protein
MQSIYPDQFERDMGCTEAEWLAALPGAIGTHPSRRTAQAVSVQIGTGHLALTWRPDAPRVLGLARIPRLCVSFRFNGLDDGQRHAFMARFDLYMQKGGG